MDLKDHEIEIECLNLIDLFDSWCKHIKSEFDLCFEESLLKTYLILESNDYIISLKKKWGDFTILLSKISFFKNEFQKMLSMKYMFEYIVDNIVLFKKYWKFIAELSNLFFENLDYKIKIKNDSLDKEYEKEYKKFLRAFMKKEKFFYTVIYSRSDCYDESTLEKVTNLLVS